MTDTALAHEVQMFERLLGKPDRVSTGSASAFTSGEVGVARVPARLDVMGGITNGSGANVCEASPGWGVLPPS